MKKRYFKRISAIVLAMVMVLGMSVAAFAANDANPDTVGDATNAEFETTNTTVNIPKGIIVTNAEQIKVYGPEITYTYEVNVPTVADGTKIVSTVTDHAGTRTVKAGPTGGLTITTQPSFGGTETAVALGTNGMELKSNLVLNVDIEKFEAAGIYRYEIKDVTDTAVLTNAGVTRDTAYNTDRYIDIYVKNNGTTLQMYGYTVINANETTINGDGNDTTVKNPGYVSGSEVDTNGNITTVGTIPCDRYNTINVTLEKEVTGGLGDKTHPFPFNVTVANSGIKFYTTLDTAANVQGTQATVATFEQALKHGEKLFVKGLNPKATVTYVETNDTTDTYKVTSAVTLSGPAATTNEVAPEGTAATEALKVSNYVDYSTQNIVVDATNGAVKYINNLEEISPTGVVLRFGPYMAIMAAGIALAVILVVRKRRREMED